MDRAVDILHPLASLEWRECRGPPVDVGDAQAVWLKDKVYVGGGVTSGSFRDYARLYIYTPTTDTWDTPIDTPVYSFALTTYRSQLVLVGGWEYVPDEYGKGERTNKLWTLSEHGQWQETLPPMPTACTGASAVSHGDHLLVIGRDYPNNKAYVYNCHHWASAQHLSQLLYNIRSTIFNGHLYLMGGGLYQSQETNVYSASLDSLIASCQPSETSQPSSVWKRLTDVRRGYCYPVVFGNRLIAVGGGLYSTPTSIHAYSSFTQSWEHMGDAPLPPSGLAPCAIVLPSNELMVVRGWRAFKVTLKTTPFNPESPFNMSALSLLESAAGIPVMRTLRNYTQRIEGILGLVEFRHTDLNTLLKYWISNVGQVPLTWKSLLLIIRLLNLDDLAHRMETYLSGATEELSPISGTDGDEDVDEQLRLRDDTIFHLKQEMSTMQQRIEDQKSELKGQRSPSQIKEGGEGDTEAKLRLQEEKIFDMKQQMSTMQQRIDNLKDENEELKIRHSLPPIKEEVEEKPVALLPVKTELKEEAVTMTKAETMSAQPTTATWNLRGVEMCGEMTVTIYSSHYQQITWKGFGLKLHIQEGSLPAGMEQCILQIKASLTGQYEFPQNSHLVSAIFWLRCETVHKFTKPITVEIQHCAKSENVNLNFVRAVCSQQQLPYTFKQLSGGNFTSHSSYGVIELTGFSGLAVVKKGIVKREYRSKIFYLSQRGEIHFVVTWNTEAHLTVIEKEYIKKRAHSGPEQNIEFESDMITLDIPLKGKTIKGWKITPLIRPVVTKEEVDNFIPGMGTPHCQLKVEFKGKGEKIPILKDITLHGAKYPHNFFKIDLSTFCNTDTTVESQTFGDLTTAGPPPTKKMRLDGGEGQSNSNEPVDRTMYPSPAKPELKDLVKELYSTSSDKWEDIGILLGIEPGRLNAIKTAENHTAQSCLREMLKIWLNRVSPPPSWSAIAEAIELLGDQTLANHLRTNYQVPQTQD